MERPYRSIEEAPGCDAVEALDCIEEEKAPVVEAPKPAPVVAAPVVEDDDIAW